MLVRSWGIKFSRILQYPSIGVFVRKDCHSSRFQSSLLCVTSKFLARERSHDIIQFTRSDDQTAPAPNERNFPPNVCMASADFPSFLSFENHLDPRTPNDETLHFGTPSVSISQVRPGFYIAAPLRTISHPIITTGRSRHRFRNQDHFFLNETVIVSRFANGRRILRSPVCAVCVRISQPSLSILTMWSSILCRLSSPHL